MSELTSWQCDRCKSPVAAEDGYVIWGRKGDGNYFDFRIIHQGRCDDGSYPASYPLTSFLGPDGAARLTSMLSIGPLKLANGEKEVEISHALTGWVDFFRRVQLPGYEEARATLLKPEAAERLSDWCEVSPYFSEALEEIAAGKYV